MSASKTGDAPRKMDFFSLPPEIRNEIYSLLVVSPKPIKICSPRSKHQIRKKLNPSNFCQLLCVNKQINAESAMMFYAVNTFSIGNGPFGSKALSNLHALQEFIKRVPKNHLNGIRRVNLEIHLRRYKIALYNWALRYSFGTAIDARNLQSVARALTKHFKSLEVVEFQYAMTGPPWAEHFEHPRLPGAQVTRAMTNTFQTLLKNGSPVEIRAYNQYEIDMAAARDETLKEHPAAENTIKIYPLA